MKKRMIAIMTVLVMAGATLAGCGGTKETDGLSDTNTVDKAIENAALIEDASGFTYTGEAPITEDGGTVTIIAQKSNYANVDITKAPIVLKVFEEAGVEPEFELYDYDSYETQVEPILNSGKTDADIIKLPVSL